MANGYNFNVWGISLLNTDATNNKSKSHCLDRKKKLFTTSVSHDTKWCIEVDVLVVVVVVKVTNVAVVFYTCVVDIGIINSSRPTNIQSLLFLHVRTKNPALAQTNQASACNIAGKKGNWGERDYVV